MAAYRWLDGLVTCGLTACTPRSAQGPMLGMGELYLYLMSNKPEVEIWRNFGLTSAKIHLKRRQIVEILHLINRTVMSEFFL